MEVNVLTLVVVPQQMMAVLMMADLMTQELMMAVQVNVLTLIGQTLGVTDAHIMKLMDVLVQKTMLMQMV